MKKLSIKKIVLILAGIFVLFGGLATALVFIQVLPSESAARANENRIPYNETFELALNDGEGLKISIPGANIQVAPYDGDTLKASFEGTIRKDRQQQDRLIARRTSSQAEIIQQEENDHRVRIFSFGGDGMTGVRGILTVQVPKKQLSRVALTSFSGEIDARGLQATELTVNNSAESILLEGIRLEGALFAETFSSDVRITNTVANGAARVSASSGGLTLRDCEFGSASLETFSGGIDVTNFSSAGQASIVTSSGGITVQTLRAQTLKAENFAGDISLESITLEGSFTADNSSGETNAKGLAASSVKVTSFSGGVTVTGLFADEINVTTSDGDVQLALDKPAGIFCETFSGHVGLSLPADMGFTLLFDTFSGNLTSTFPSMGISSSGSMDTAIGDGAHRVNVVTSSGDLRIDGQ